MVIPSVADPDPESGSRIFLPLDSGSGSGSGMEKSGSGIRDPGLGFLCKKYLNFLSTQCCGAGSGIRDLVLIDPGSGIRCLLTLDPGSEMAKNPDPGSDIIILGPQHYSDHSSLGTPIPLNTAQ